MASHFTNPLGQGLGQLGAALGQGQNPPQMNQQAMGQMAQQDFDRQSMLQQQMGGGFAHYERGRRSGMQYYGIDWPRQPIPVRCDGWTSDTITLQRHGYKFMVDRDMARMTYNICIGKAGARSMIAIMDLQYEDYIRTGRPLEFHGEFIMAMSFNQTKENNHVHNFVSVDMNDVYWCEQEVGMVNRHIDVRDLFPQSDTAPESMIVLPDAQTVTEVLDLLLEKQAPRSDEVREQQKKRERRVATILQLEDVA